MRHHTTVRLMAIGILAAIVMTSVPEPADAHPYQRRSGSACNLLRIAWEPAGSWSGKDHLGPAVSAAMQDWHQINNYQGQQLVPSATSSTARIQVRWSEAPGGNRNSNGHVNCSSWPPTMTLNENLDTEAAVRVVARHEFGHWLGLFHTGRSDSFGGETPAMATCIGRGLGRTVSNDDFGALVDRRDNIARGGVTANPGFENGLRYWEGGNGLTAQLGGGAGRNGNGYAVIRATTDHSFLQVQANHVDYPGSLSRSGDHSFGIWLAARTSGISYGHMRSTVQFRSVSYDPPGTCSYSTGRDQNERSTGRWVEHINNYLLAPGGVSWTSYTTSSWSRASWGLDMRGRLYPRVTSDPSGILRTSLHVDDMRVQRFRPPGT